MVTQLRDPIQRVISAYEFSIEVAGRKIHLSDQEFLKQKANTSAVNTFNVWPWSYLIPLSRNQMKDRVRFFDCACPLNNLYEFNKPLYMMQMGDLEDIAAEKGLASKWEEHFDNRTNRTFYYDKETNTSYWAKPEPRIKLNPYKNVLTMPLEDWLETDEAYDLVHNGATLQILGITNTSFWPEAGLLRKCFIRDAASRATLLSLAKEKLKTIPHVGLQEHLDDSVASLAATLQVKWDNPAYKSLPLKAYFYDPPGTDLDKEIVYNSTDAGGKNVIINIRKARQILHRMTFEGQEVRKKLKKLEPKLSSLVEEEEEWLDEQEEQQKRGWSRFESYFRSIKNFAKSALSRSSSDDSESNNDNDELLESSPFNSEIVELDAQVHALQKRDIVIRHEYHTLIKIPEVKGVEFNATVKAYVPVLDEEQIDKKKVLGDNYKDCAATAIRKGRSKRRKSFLHLRTPQDESFVFSSSGRKNISEKIISRIEELNQADLELYAFGKNLFRETIEKQKEADSWKQFAHGFEKKVQNLTTDQSNSTLPSQDSNTESSSSPSVEHTEL